MTDRTDITLGIDDIDPDDLPRVWQTLTNVAQGFALDGFEVSVRTYRQDDDGGYDEVFQTVGPESEAQ